MSTKAHFNYLLAKKIYIIRIDFEDVNKFTELRGYTYSEAVDYCQSLKPNCRSVCITEYAQGYRGIQKYYRCMKMGCVSLTY